VSFEQSPPAPDPYHSDKRSGLRVLVVDDNPSKRYSMARSLSAAGFTVDEAATGREGIEQLGGHHAVVLDVDLPDVNGFDACREMRRKAPGVPIVQVSSVFTQESYRAAGRLAGATTYLADPGVTELIEAVDSVLGKR
jgi:DNA-binding response OmpR family regulator